MVGTGQGLPTASCRREIGVSVGMYIRAHTSDTGQLWMMI